MIVRDIFDNVIKSSDKWENYLEVYERHTRPFLDNKPYNIVEVGVQGGGSLEMWSSLFSHPDTTITGIDIDTKCAKLKYNDPQINVIIGDQGKPEFWDEFLKGRPPIHIFIEDGGHFMNQQILTFQKVFPVMPVGSVYICEDVHTSYMPYNGGGIGRPGTFMEFAKDLADVLHIDWWEGVPETEKYQYKKLANDLTSIHFYDSIVVFEKFGKKEMKRVFPKRFSSDQ